jgi:hypothetical protein
MTDIGNMKLPNNPIEVDLVGDFCILTGKDSYEKAHVIDDKDFSDVWEFIFSTHCEKKNTTDSNLVNLRKDIHRDYMDSLDKPVNLRQRRLGFDFINKKCYSQDFDTNEIIEWPWLVEGIDVHNVYLAWSNSRHKSTKLMSRHLKKIDRRLIDINHWK